MSVTFTVSPAAAKVLNYHLSKLILLFYLFDFTHSDKLLFCFGQKLNHVMMAMAQLLNIRMPGSYEVTFPPQNADLPGVDGPGKKHGQSGGCFKIQVLFLFLYSLYILFHNLN